MRFLRSFLLCAVILIPLVLPSLLTGFASPPTIKRPYEIIEATIDGGSPYTVDPSFVYDTASGELLQNVYDTLVFLDGEHVDRFLPQLATEWTQQNITGTISPEGLPLYWRYTFRIRQNVPFHNSTFGNLTAEDVEYCFEREMVLDMSGGPQWMLYEPLLNGAMATFVNQTTYDPANNTADRVLVGKMIDHAVESNASHVWFNLAFPGAYAPFMKILSQPWSSIYSKQWALSLGRSTNWDGNWSDYTGWWAYHDPATAPLDDPSPAIMGTGPFMLETINQTGMYWSVTRNPNYWRGWPLDWPAGSGSKPAGYIEHLVVSWAYIWSTRSAMFLNGDVDFCAVPRQYVSSMVGQPGIRCTYPLPSLAVNALFYNFDINPSTPYGPVFDYGVFNETGIPRDFFGNASWGVHVRKAFSYAIDYDTYLSAVYLGEGQHPATAIIPGLPYYDPTIKGYTYNLTRVAEELHQVPGLWDTGFTVQLPYSAGCTFRGTVQQMIKQSLESLNPKFHAILTGVIWSAYLYARDHGQLTAFPLGWLADYPDPHDFAYAFYYSKGIFVWRTNYSNPTMDALITAGINTPDGPQRAQIYHDIQQLAIDDCPSTTVDQATGRQFERDWVAGWYYNPNNPIYSGNYAANLWKWYYIPHALLDNPTQPFSNYLPYDINYDGTVNMRDVGAVAASAFASFGPPMSARWLFRGDLNNDRQINMQDIGMVAQRFSETSPAWVPPS